MENRRIVFATAAAALAWPAWSLLGLVNSDPSAPYSSMGDETKRRLGMQLDPKTITSRRQKGASASKETSHDSDDFCVAKVDDGTILTGSVLDEGGHAALSLPDGYRAEFGVECTKYERHTEGAVQEEESVIVDVSTRTGVARQGGIYEPRTCGDPKYFRPGYFDRSTTTWVDHCTGRVFEASETAREARTVPPLSPANCPMIAERLQSSRKKEPLWIAFVGDSVTRQMYSTVMKEHGTIIPGKGIMPGKWRDYEFSPNVARWSVKYYVAKVEVEGLEVWLTFQFHYFNSNSLGEKLPRTWGEYVDARDNSGYPRSDAGRYDPTVNPDPPFDVNREPDLAFFSPGYHATDMSSRDYGAETESVLRGWLGDASPAASRPPPMHLFLNMMPAPWLIPEPYASDRTRRTLLNEYRKNLAIIEASKKFDFVRSVVDVFSVELPFNGTPEDTVHGDAVHVLDRTVLGIAADRVLEAICTTDLNDAGEGDGGGEPQVWKEMLYGDNLE